MRKIIQGLLVALCVLLCGAALADGDQIPAAILEHLTQVMADDYALSDVAVLEPQGYAFATLQGKDGHNVLYCYRKKNGAWDCWLQTDRVVFQGKGRITAYCAQPGTTYILDPAEANRYPLLIILQDDESSESSERFITFALVDGKWLLTKWDDCDYCCVIVTDNALTYYNSWLGEHAYQGKVAGSIQRDIRWAGIDLIPHTLSKARKKISAPPEIPAASELKVQDVKLTGGKKYAVYSAPDAGSLRGGKGKAAVSTNGWIQVFGAEDEWLLVQYAIDSTHCRFGYIRGSALPKNVSVPELGFLRRMAWLTEDCAVTDDPLYSEAELVRLYAGCPVTLLATLGDWAYIESSHGDDLRGFVPLRVLSAEQRFALENCPADDGTAMYHGEVTWSPAGVVTATLSIAPEGPLSGQAVEKVYVYDTLNDTLCFICEKDEDGQFYGGCALDAQATSLRFEAVGADGEAISGLPQMRVEK